LRRREREGLVILPVLIRPCDWEAHEWIRATQMLPSEGKSVALDFKGKKIDIAYTQVAKRVRSIVDGKYQVPTATPQFVRPPDDRIQLNELPMTGAELVGRQKELDLLDRAWSQRHPKIVAFIAWGGVGKTTLVRKWVERLDADNFRGAERVYAWSFSPRPGSEAGAADLFIRSALTFFGDPDPNAGSPWQKGERLADLVQQAPTLLVLDGLEVLQSQLSINRGKINDPAIAVLLQSLAHENPGLCVVTTHNRLTDLDDLIDSVRQHDLEQISIEAGRALLRISGIHGTDAQLEQATREFGQQALAVNLLASFLRASPDKSIAGTTAIGDLNVPDDQGRQPRRIMAAFQPQLEGTVALDVLRILGLYDQRIGRPAIDALRNGPALPGLTDAIQTASEAGLLRALNDLRRWRFIAPESSDQPDAIDAHPIVRTHFSEQLQREQPATWMQANGRVYEYLKNSSLLYPETLQDMLPLYAAIMHGCRAGRHQECFDRVYLERIQRQEQYFTTKHLGAFGTNLEALGSFFEARWTKPLAVLTGRAQIELLGSAGDALLVLGRIAEAVLPLKSALERAVASEKWKDAAEQARNLSAQSLSIGKIDDAIGFSERALDLAAKSRHGFTRIFMMGALGEAYHQAGRVDEAATLFAEAERLLREEDRRFPRLYAFAGYLYCDLLLTLGRAAEVRERAIEFFTWRVEGDSLLAKGVEHLAMGRACLMLGETDDPQYWIDAAIHLDHAVDWLRQSSYQNYVPLGLLARAAFRRHKDEWEWAKDDLDECLRIARRSGMLLHEADAHLEYARVELARVDVPEAEKHLRRAEQIVTDTGYHRRDREVRGLRAAMATKA
jgi:tetratricopeptide (TPR) repeat protein